MAYRFTQKCVTIHDFRGDEVFCPPPPVYPEKIKKPRKKKQKVERPKKFSWPKKEAGHVRCMVIGEEAKTPAAQDFPTKEAKKEIRERFPHRSFGLGEATDGRSLVLHFEKQETDVAFNDLFQTLRPGCEVRGGVLVTVISTVSGNLLNAKPSDWEDFMILIPNCPGAFVP